MKLDIGCGETPREGFVGVDRKLNSEAFPLAHDDNSIDEIYCSHALEHFHWRITERVLRDWTRVLKPGGLMRIAVPNFEWILQNRNHPHFEGYIYGGGADVNDGHGALFTARKLTRQLIASGLTEVQEWQADQKDCAALPVSLNLQGTKSAAFPESPNIEAVCSRPQYGPLLTAECAVLACVFNRVLLRKAHGGCWWEKSLQNMFEDMIEDGVDIAITYDFDSSFTPQDMAFLIKTMKERPDIDALAGIQPQRGSGEAMMQPVGDSPKIINAELQQMRTAHFGLTAIRLARLKDIPKPWFLNQPGFDGSWRKGAPGHTDADIHFWRQWEAYGRTLFVTGAVCVGHGEPTISKIDIADGKTKIYSVHDWEGKGTPLEKA